MSTISKVLHWSKFLPETYKKVFYNRKTSPTLLLQKSGCRSQNELIKLWRTHLSQVLIILVACRAGAVVGSISSSDVIGKTWLLLRLVLDPSVAELMYPFAYGLLDLCRGGGFIRPAAWATKAGIPCDSELISVDLLYSNWWSERLREQPQIFFSNLYI